jgi:glycosyltransferase involved in cell wall biosynthesis
VPELITEGVEGFLIEPGDRAVLSDRLCRLEGDPLLRSRMGQAARRRVEADFSLDAAVDRLMLIYQEALKGA